MNFLFLGYSVYIHSVSRIFPCMIFFVFRPPTLINFLIVRLKVAKGILYRNHVTVCNLVKNLKC